MYFSIGFNLLFDLWVIIRYCKENQKLNYHGRKQYHIPKGSYMLYNVNGFLNHLSYHDYVGKRHF